MFKGRDSTFHITQGFNQSGKTDFNLLLADHLVEYGYFKHFGTNQPLINSPFEYDSITDLTTLIKRCITLKKPYLYFLDELALSANKNTAWEKTNLGLIKALDVRRKYRLHILGAGIGEIDRRIKSPLHLDTFIEKTGLTSAVIHHIQHRKTLPLYGIPRTRVKFLEHTATLFTDKPAVEIEAVNDIDIRIALQWARKEPYTGDLSKPSYYDQIRRGITKLQELSKLTS